MTPPCLRLVSRCPGAVHPVPAAWRRSRIAAPVSADRTRPRRKDANVIDLARADQRRAPSPPFDHPPEGTAA